MQSRQHHLFAPDSLPEGFELRHELLCAAEEALLLRTIRELPFQQARYKEWRAKRRVVSYGGRYDFTQNELLPSGPIPPFLHELRDRIASWTGTPAARLSHALIAEYAPGTQLGWHRDVSQFEVVAGVSLGGRARMRLRPYPPRGNRRTSFAVELEPRSAYSMAGRARWGWQHAISPTKELRYSITFRTLRRSAT